MSEALAYFSGQFIPQSAAHIPLHDAGFVFGATATDLCRTFRHRLFRFPEHLARFWQSCEAARIPQLRSAEELRTAAEELVAHNARLLPEEQDLALVLLATPGPLGFYLGHGGANGPPTLVMHTFPLPQQRYAHLFQEGARLIIPSRRHLPPDCIDPRIKHRSRLHWWLAEQEARTIEPTASALLLNQEGFVTETAAANFLVVRKGIVATPPTGTVLEGISLQVVAEHCAGLGIPFQRQPITVEECLSADEAFISSTSFCIAGVRTINGTAMGWPGPFYQRLLTTWSQQVGVDIRAQFSQ